MSCWSQPARKPINARAMRESRTTDGRLFPRSIDFTKALLHISILGSNSNETSHCPCSTMRHLGDFFGTETFEKRSGCRPVKLGVGGFDAEEEPVAGGEREACYVEQRVVGPGQAVQAEHAEH